MHGERSYLLDFPPEVVSQILNCSDVSHASLLLWKCGSKLLHHKMGKFLSSVRLLSDEKILEFEIPKFLLQLHNLRELTIGSARTEIRWWMQLSDALRALPPTLERLILPFDNSNSLFDWRPTGYTEELLDDAEYHDEDEWDEERQAYVIRSPSAVHQYVPLKETFPTLKTLTLGGGYNYLMVWQDHNSQISALPETLTSLECLAPGFSVDPKLPLWAAALPRGLLRLTLLSPISPMNDFFSSLPRTLTDLVCSFMEPIPLTAYRDMPPALTRLGSSFEGTWDLETALSFPSSILRLSVTQIDLEHTEETLLKLPPKLQHLSILISKSGLDASESFAMTPSLLRCLPRTLTYLACDLSTTQLEIGDLPQGLTSLMVWWSEETIAAVEFAAALPRSLTHLTLNGVLLPAEPLFFTHLPQGLKTLQANIGDIDGNVDLPLRLTTLALGPKDTFFREEASQFEDDMDATLNPVVVADMSAPLYFATTATLSLTIKRPFPFHALPKTLTELRYTERPFVVQALRFVPLLRRLVVRQFVHGASWNPKEPVLIEAAALNREFGQTLEKRAELASTPLTSVTLFDLLPRGLAYLDVWNPGELAEVPYDDWWCFEGLYDLILGNEKVFYSSSE